MLPIDQLIENPQSLCTLQYVLAAKAAHRRRHKVQASQSVAQ